MQIDEQSLMQICPHMGKRLCDLYLPFINAAMDEFKINTKLRQAAFIAQVAHESGEFRYMREIWGSTAVQLGYESRKDLGNVRIGDGQRYKGRGAIQLTGRANYTKYGELLGIDLVNYPELAEQKGTAFRIAGCFWDVNKLNELADIGDMLRITRRINGGTNGYKERMNYYQRAMGVIQ